MIHAAHLTRNMEVNRPSRSLLALAHRSFHRPPPPPLLSPSPNPQRHTKTQPFSYHFVLGGALVLGGLAANVMIKERRKAKKVPPPTGAAALEGKAAANATSADDDVESGGGGGKRDGSGVGAGGNVGGGSKSHGIDSRSRSEQCSSAFPATAIAGTGDGGDRAACRVLPATPAEDIRDRVHNHKRKEKQQQNGRAGGNGHAQDGLLQSWRPTLMGPFSRWRGPAAAQDLTGGDDRGRSVTFGAKVGAEGEAMQPLLVSKGRGSGSADQ